MEDDGIRAHALKILGRKDQSLVDIVQTLQIYHDNIDDEPESKEADIQGSAPLREIDIRDYDSTRCQSKVALGFVEAKIIFKAPLILTSSF